MNARTIGFLVGALALLLAIFLPPPAGMSREAFVTAGLVMLMANWWMTEAMPLTAATNSSLSTYHSVLKRHRELYAVFHGPVEYLSERIPIAISCEVTHSGCQTPRMEIEGWSEGYCP